MVKQGAEFNVVKNLTTEAIGKPGERTFRILVNGDLGFGIVWLEKEQLLRLALTIKQLTTFLVDTEIDMANQGGPSYSAVTETILDCRAEKLVLVDDESGGRFRIDVYEDGLDVADEPSVRIWVLKNQALVFANQSIRVCAAGRPLCTLCGGPIDVSGHLCPRVNGHALYEITGN